MQHIDTDKQNPLSDEEYGEYRKRVKPRGAFGEIWSANGEESAYSVHRHKVATIAMARLDGNDRQRERGNKMKSLREMAKILLVDRISTEVEVAFCDGDEESVWSRIGEVNISGGELMDIVPDALLAHGVDLDAAINSLIPEMARLVKAIDTAWGGKVTLSQLEEIGGDRVFTTSAMMAAGHGLAIDDDPIVAKRLGELGLAVPRGIYLNDGKLENALGIVEDALNSALEGNVVERR